MSFKKAVLLTLLGTAAYLWYTGELDYMLIAIEGLGEAYGGASKRGL